MHNSIVIHNIWMCTQAFSNIHVYFTISKSITGESIPDAGLVVRAPTDEHTDGTDFMPSTADTGGKEERHPHGLTMRSYGII